jgi:transposase
MDRREALRQQFAGQPLELLEHALKLEAELSATQARLAEVEAQLMEAQAYIEELQRRLSGNKAECLSPEQKHKLDQLRKDLLEQAQRPAPLSQEVLEEEGEKKERRPAERRSRPHRHPLPISLETETVTLEPETTTCPHCGREQNRIGEEVTEELDWVPAKLIRRRTVRPKYACRCSESSVAIAPLPPRLIPQSKLGLGLAIYIVLTRFDDHLSLYRLEQIFAERYEVVIPRQQMVQWIEHIAQWLKPIYEAMWQAMKEGDYLQIDETPVKVLDPEVQGRAAKGYLWFYAVPGGDVILEFCASRGEQVPREKLVGFRGTIQTDAYEVYRALKRKNPALERNGCLAHARRKFYKALEESFTEAVWFIERIRELYGIEDQVRALPPAERQVVRQEQAPTIWEALQKRAQELKPKLLPKSTLGKAVRYFLNEYQALTGYLRDGRFEIDNNLVENAIRPAAVGRRRWLFIGHPQAGWRSAVIYSILISCRRRGLNPQEYLTDVLARLPLMKIQQIHELLPSQWRPPSANTS